MAARSCYFQCVFAVSFFLIYEELPPKPSGLAASVTAEQLQEVTIFQSHVGFNELIPGCCIAKASHSHHLEELLSSFVGFIFRQEGSFSPIFLEVLSLALKRGATIVLISQVFPPLILANSSEGMPDSKRNLLEKEGFLFRGYEELSDHQAEIKLKLVIACKSLQLAA